MAIALLDAAIGFAAGAARAAARRSARRATAIISLHRRQPHARHRDRTSRTCASAMRRCRRSSLLVPILVSAVGGGRAGRLERHRIDQIERRLPSARLDDEHRVVAVAEVEPVFEQRREHRADAGMPRRDEPLDDRLPCRRSRPRGSSPSAARKASSWADWAAGRRSAAPAGRAAARERTASPPAERASCSVTCSSVPSTPWSWCCSCRTSA